MLEPLWSNLRDLLFSVHGAEFNLGMAVAAAQSLEAGVYVCMSGLVLPAKDALRDAKSGLFLRRPR
jgi:hypothetical protein